MKYYAGPWQWVSTPGIGSHYAAPSGAIALVDLRTMETQSSGNHTGGVGSGFFCVPDDVSLSADYELLATGDLRESQIGGAQRSAWESVFGVTLPQSTDVLIDALAYTLTDGSDPDGSSAPRPLVPSVGPPVGEASISLAGHSVVWRRHMSPQTGNSKHAKALRDLLRKDLENIADNHPDPDFWRKVMGYQKAKYGQRWNDDSEDWLLTAKLRAKGKGRNGRTSANKADSSFVETWPADGSPDTSQDLGWTEQPTFTSGCSVSSGQLVTDAAATEYRIKMNSAVSGNDNRSYSTFKSYNAAGLAQQNPLCRAATSTTQTFYVCYCQNNGGTKSLLLYKFVTGTPTDISSGANTLSVDDTWGPSVNGSSISRNKNGSAVATVTDTAIASGTLGGTGGYADGSGSGFASDTWVFEDIPTATARPDLGLLLGVS